MIHGVCGECANTIRGGCLGGLSLSHESSNWNLTRIGLWAVEQAPWRLRCAEPNTPRRSRGWFGISVSENRAPLNPMAILWVSR